MDAAGAMLLRTGNYSVTVHRTEPAIVLVVLFSLQSALECEDTCTRKPDNRYSKWMMVEQ